MWNKQEVLADFRLATLSRHCSLIGRKEVLNGRAKFGIFGDGKEIAQVALAKVFRRGDWRSGYYRDQSLMLALDVLTPESFFAQLYADTDRQREPASRGRQMNCHFATRYLDDHGNWTDQRAQYNSSADISPTGGQMARLLGLAYASKLYRHVPELADASFKKYSSGGQEIAFGTIGNASAAEGVFWESLNAAGVLQLPYLISVWDDGYGISVPNRLQLTKESISKLLAGFAGDAGGKGFDILHAQGHDYAQLVKVYRAAEARCREHRPCLVHISDMTQPQGHSTSGSHERYKSTERLEFEQKWDCITRMKLWIVEIGIASAQELTDIEAEALEQVVAAKNKAWQLSQADLADESEALVRILKASVKFKDPRTEASIAQLAAELENSRSRSRRQIHTVATKALISSAREEDLANSLRTFLRDYGEKLHTVYQSCLFKETASPLQVASQAPKLTDAYVDGREIIRDFFSTVLARDPRLFILGEDVGELGGVNLEFEGLARKYGEYRVTDTGIREATILGQGIGAAMRGLRPIVDIQYLDYLVFALQGLTDDLATLHYRSGGGQAAPVIVRTKGHRLEGIWHTGSPMGMLLGSCRGMHLCVPRNCTQAAGLYQTLLLGDDPAIVVEVLNGYRLKEAYPGNLGEYTVRLGEVQVLGSGDDVSLISYGACIAIASQAREILANLGIGVELIDIQTLLPFDREQRIASSVAKTNAIVVVDEDVPGGASAYMLREVLEVQNAYEYLDAPPRTVTAKSSRSPYGSDGDYFVKPNVYDIVSAVYAVMHERQPKKFPSLFG